jgi:hypothetical protein
MTDKTISDLTAYSSLDPSSDLFPVWDSAAQTTKKLSASQLFSQYIVGTSVDCGTFVDAVTALATAGTECTLVIPSTINETITGDLTVPAEINLLFERGALITIPTGKTLTINGPIEAGPWQIFAWAGTGATTISGSPTATVYPEWWGAVAETSGWIQDNSAAFTKIFASIHRMRQEVFLSKGWYRIISAVTLGNTGLRMRGSGIFTSGIWIELTGGTGTGVTFGDGTTASEAVELEDFGFIGPANCCEYGVDFRVANPHVKRVNFFMGSSAYAIRSRSCEVYDMNVYSYSNNSQPATTAAPAGVFLAEKDPTTAWANNTFKLNIQTLGNNTLTAVYLKDVETTIELSGSIQASASAAAPFQIDANAGPLRITDLYTEGFSGDAIITNCNSVHIDNIEYFLDTSTLRLVNCDGVSIRGGWIWNLNVNAGCRGVVIEGTTIRSLVDYAPDTHYIGRMPKVSTTDYKTGQAPDRDNIWYNSTLKRWNASGPEGYGTVYNLTATKETSIIHLAKASCKLVTSGATAFVENVLDATQLQRVLGKFLTFSTAINVKDDADLNAYPVYISISTTVPDWSAVLTPNIGDAVKATGALYAGVFFVATAVSAATGATEPDWIATSNPPVENQTFTDGGVTWVCKPRGATDYEDLLNDPYTSAMAGTWHTVRQNFLVPGNATAVTTRIYVRRRTEGSETTAYLAEPTMVVSNQGVTGLVESVGEFQNYIQIGANKITYGTAVPSAGEWCQQGDIVWRTDATTGQHPGWICTGSGTGGGTATWKAMANVA